MLLHEHVLGIFLVFCRIGSCLMVVPGLATARVPSRVRLYFAVALALVLAPVVDDGGARSKIMPVDLVPLIFGECVVGLLIGLLARLVLEMLSFAGVAISNYVGLSALSGMADSDGAQPAVGSLVTLIGTMLLIFMEFPQRLVLLLAQSYVELPPGTAMDQGNMVRQITSGLKAATVMALQLSGPFLVYGIIVNLLFALLGKLVPQVSSYFISGPFLAIGGLTILYLLIGELFRLLALEFENTIFLRH